MEKYLTAGDSHLVVEFGQTINLEDNLQVHALARHLTQLAPTGLREVVPTYRSLLISFDPLMLEHQALQQLCQAFLANSAGLKETRREIIEIPTLYGGEYGMDLASLAEEVGLSEQEVIDIHTSKEYPIYMIGFMPGYPYAGGLSRRIAVPRHKTPRTKVPAGSVAVAEQQTGVYPISSPGGWRLIGHTPIKLYTPERMPPTLLRAGQYMKFVAVDLEKYNGIKALVDRDEYVPRLIVEEVR